MKSAAPASRVARRTSSIDASGSANARFSRTLSENRNVSSNTMPTARRSSCNDEVAHVDAVDEHPAAVDVVEARDESGDRRLAARGRPDDGDGLAGAQREVEPVEHGRTLAVRELDALEPHLTTAVRRQLDAARRVGDLGRGVEDLVDAPAAAEARDDCATSWPDIRSGTTSMRM